MNLTMPELFTHLLSERHFYARIANSMRQVQVPGLGTMAVGINKGRVVLFYDPAFLKRISYGLALYVLDHEMVHIIMDHIARFLEVLSNCPDELSKTKASIVFNVAADCADNSLLRGNKYFELAKAESRALAQEECPNEILSEKAGMVLPENWDLPINKSLEYYLGALMERVEVVPAGGMAGRGHRLWISTTEDASSPDALREMTGDEMRGLAEQVRTQMKNVLRKAVADQELSQGLVPGNLVEWLAEYLAEPVIPWWEVLTSRVKTAKRTKVERGISKPNRMLLAMAEEDTDILPSIGKLRDPRFRVFFVVDTSMSMDTRELLIARSELTHLLAADDDMEVRMIQGDAAVHFDQVFHSGEELPLEMHGRGGTDFNAYFAYMAQYIDDDEQVPDIVVVYTDGGAGPVLPELRLPPDVPVIWLLTAGGSRYSLEDYGEIIDCDPDQNKKWTG